MKVKITNRNGMLYKGKHRDPGEVVTIKSHQADTLIRIGWVTPVDDEGTLPEEADNEAQVESDD